MADLIGQQLGNYRLIRLLGHGGFGEVYLGQHLRLNKQAAIKVQRLRLADEDIEAFHAEAQTIASLDHPHIVQVLDYDVKDGVPFLVMDYAPNGSLRQRHPRGERLALPLIVSYVKQVADALQYAHDQRLMHRDVKPDNMLLGRRHEVVLTDFGLATIAHHTSSQDTQVMAGTVPYMAPEQVQGKPRLASDQYALGIVVYEWLSGRRPFNGTATEIAMQHVLAPVPSLREQGLTISAEVEQVVLTALAKDPKQRFRTVQAFATALEQACQPAPSRPLVVPSQETLPHEASRPSDEKRMASEPSQGSLPTPVVTPPSQPALPTEPVTSSSQALLPTEPATSSGRSGEPRVGTVPSSPHGGVPPIPEEPLAGEPAQSADEMRAPSPNQALLPAEAVTPPLQTPPPKRAPGRKFSRRTVVIGLAAIGVVAAGGGITWWLSPHPLSRYTGHANIVDAVAWSPDGKRIASGSYDHTVQVWDATTGTNVLTYQGHADVVDAVAWSPDGKRIASGSHDNTVQVWNAADGSQVYKYPGHADIVLAVAWSPDGKRIASGSWDKTVQVWNAADGSQAYTYTGHTDGVLAVAWSPAGKRIASGSFDKTVQVWNATDGGNVFKYTGHSDRVWAVAWSPDGRRIASGSGDKTVQVWNAADGSQVYKYTGHSGTVDAVAWSPDGRRIASGSGDKTVQVWQAP